MDRRMKKDFCLKCDTADREKIGKGKTCKVCESELWNISCNIDIHLQSILGILGFHRYWI